MIKLVCAGRLKERFYADGAAYYQSRASKSVPIQIIEVPDESAPENLSEAQKRKIKEKEGEAILRQINAATTVVALDMNGEKFSKAEIGAIIRKHSGDVAFVIGGSLGLGENVRKRADYRWSLSEMTLPHQLARVAVVSTLCNVIRRAFNLSCNWK